MSDFLSFILRPKAKWGPRFTFKLLCSSIIFWKSKFDNLAALLEQ